MAFIEPTIADLRARYPAFAAVADATITYWLTDSARYVDTSWSESDYGPGKVAHAAYEMAQKGVAGLAGGDIVGMAAAGVTDFQSGTFRARFSDEAVKKALAGGYQSNQYGQDYYDLLQRNKGGPIASAPGSVPCNVYPYGLLGRLPC